MKHALALSALLITGTLFTGGLLAGGALLTSPAAAQSYPMIEIKLDRAKVMRVSRPASMIVIGNPAIADATIKDSQTLIITGKQYGTTNLIVLDADGEPIADEVLRVSSANDNDVVIYKGASRQTLSCSPNCEPVFRIGDDMLKINELTQQIQAHNDMANGQEPQIDTEE